MRGHASSRTKPTSTPWRPPCSWPTIAGARAHRAASGQTQVPNSSGRASVESVQRVSLRVSCMLLGLPRSAAGTGGVVIPGGRVTLLLDELGERLCVEEQRHDQVLLLFRHGVSFG